MTSPKLPLLALLLGVSLSTAAAACGGNTPAPVVPAGPEPSAPPVASGTAAPPASGSVAPPVKPPVVMKPIVPSAMAADLAAIGLDPKKLPPLDKIEPQKLRKVMKTFTKALGVQCSACHDADDFKAATPKKAVATRMWNDFSRGLTFADGSPLYCDSCHQGRMESLDHADKKALSKWMQGEFVDKVKRVDGKEHGCETCHGDPFEGPFLDTVWAKKK
jgi:hypothetical protein